MTMYGYKHPPEKRFEMVAQDHPVGSKRLFNSGYNHYVHIGGTVVGYGANGDIFLVDDNGDPIQVRYDKLISLDDYYD